MSDRQLDQNSVTTVLKNILDPESGRDLITMGQVQGIKIEGNTVRVDLGLTTWAAPLWKETQQKIEAELTEKLFSKEEPGSVTVQISIHNRPPEPIGSIGLTAKSVIAVGSGKGGVGKSTIATTLAYALKNAGAKVGILDADVYGPSIPHLLGVTDRPETEEKKLIPLEKDGIQLMSIGFLVPPNEAIIWRGPMLHGVVTQFLRDTAWGELDYLIIDMPPGTGDIALTLSQLLPLTGSVVVCTPQNLALADAIKAVAMFNKVQIPVLGMVENMSYFLCPDNGIRYDIFGHGGAKQAAITWEIPFLGEVPINMNIRKRGDSGTTGDNFQDDSTSPYFNEICTNLVRNLAESRTEEPPMPTLTVL